VFFVALFCQRGSAARGARIGYLSFFFFAFVFLCVFFAAVGVPWQHASRALDSDPLLFVE
jgi:hypothetical protein